MDHEKQYLTKEKHKQLEQELENLRTVSRKEVAEDLEYAKQLGDLSENAEYHEARDRQAFIEDRIAKIDALLKSAVIVDNKHSETVGVGCTVELQKEGKKDVIVYTIVGSEETDTAARKISLASPIGAALKGKKKGDVVTVETPAGKVKYTIVKIA